jgi:hypothetical protein
MKHPVADRHLAGGDESGGPGEKAERDQRAGHGFNDRTDPHHAQELLLAGGGAGRKPEQLDEARERNSTPATMRSAASRIGSKRASPEEAIIEGSFRGFRQSKMPPGSK